MKESIRTISATTPDTKKRDRYGQLSSLEIKILQVMLENPGISNKEIGGKLGLTEGTVHTRLTTIFDKLQCGSNRLTAVELFSEMQKTFPISEKGEAQLTEEETYFIRLKKLVGNLPYFDISKFPFSQKRIEIAYKLLELGLIKYVKGKKGDRINNCTFCLTENENSI